MSRAPVAGGERLPALTQDGGLAPLDRGRRRTRFGGGTHVEELEAEAVEVRELGGEADASEGDQVEHEQAGVRVEPGVVGRDEEPARGGAGLDGRGVMG